MSDRLSPPLPLPMHVSDDQTWTELARDIGRSASFVIGVVTTPGYSPRIRVARLNGPRWSWTDLPAHVADNFARAIVERDKQ